MGMNYYGVSGYFIPVCDVIEAIEDKDIKDTLNEMLQDGEGKFLDAFDGGDLDLLPLKEKEAMQYFQEFTKCKELFEANEDVDTGGSEFINPETMLYCAYVDSELYEKTPNKTYKELEGKGILPSFDRCCAFG